jgi:hypothetical protein
MPCPECDEITRKYHEALQDSLGVRKERNQLQDKLLAAMAETSHYCEKATNYLGEANRNLDKVIDLEAQLAVEKLSPWKAIALTEAALALGGLLMWWLG